MLSHDSKQSDHNNHSQQHEKGVTYHNLKFDSSTLSKANNKHDEHKLTIDPNISKLKLTNNEMDIICVPNIKPSKSRKKRNRRAKTLDPILISPEYKQSKRFFTNHQGSMTPNQSPRLGPRSRKKSKKSKLKLMGVRAKLKLTNTESTDQPQAIINAKGSLKEMKRFGNEIGDLVTNLYLAQNKSSQLTNLLCDELTNINITNPNDQFAIYMNNIGKVGYDLENEYEKQLLNMKNNFINPMNEFNHGTIETCKELKLKLRRKKGEYDMISKEENRLRNKQHTKNVNLANVHAIRVKLKMKLDKLELIRDAFLSAVQMMKTERIGLVSAMKQFMISYGKHAKIFNDKLNGYKDSMYYIPPNINNRLDLDSDTEDINDNNETINTYNKWSNDTIILKEGFIKKKGEDRWFKLFANKKMIYFEGNQPNSALKGQIDLTKVTNIIKKAGNTLEILTKSRVWILQFESTHDRDIWYEIINGVTVTEAAMILQSVHENIHNEYINGYHTDSELITDTSHELTTDDEYQINDPDSHSISSYHGALPPKLFLSTSADTLSNQTPRLMAIPSLDETPQSKDEIALSDKSNKTIETVKFLSLQEIVERVTSPQIRGTQNQLVLILTYCLYSTREELLNIIFQRLSNVSDHQTQIKVFSLLRTWLKAENNFKNEHDDNTVGGLSPFALHLSKELLLNTGDDILLQKLAKPIISQIAMPPKLDENRARQMSLTSAPIARIPKYKNAKDLDLNKIDPTEVARQICLVEYNIFKKIKPAEFSKQKSSKHETKTKLGLFDVSHSVSEKILQLQIKELKKERSLNEEKESSQPNIDKIKDWFNKLVVWTQIEVLGQAELSERVKVISNLLKICDKLEKYNNISSLCAIRAGLCSASIHRLRKTWDNIPKKSREIKMKLDELFKLENNQRNLRERISIMKQPAIPHIGIFLGDIVFIHDGNDTFDKENGNINWNKMKLLSDRINWISMFQQSPFIFQSVPIIIQYLQSKMKMVHEDFLYKLSKNIQPPQNKKTV